MVSESEGYRPSAAVGLGPIHLRLLDGFELTVHRRPVELPPVAQRLVAYLALQDRPISRSVLAGRLWPDTTDAKAATNLRAALSKVNTRSGRLLATTPSMVGVHEAVEVDVRTGRTAAHQLLGGAASLPDGPLPDGVDHRLFAGLLLPELDDAWVVIEREQLRQLFLHALEQLSHRLIGAGRGASAVLAALVAVAADPLRESATRALIRAHLAEGNCVEAWRAFDTYRDVADVELGLTPSAELVRLIGADLAGRRVIR